MPSEYSMRDTEIVTCKYKNCLHDTKELCKSEAVRKGNSYYHEDCLQTQEEIKEIIDLFKKHINPNPVYAQLQSVIKNIVFTDNNFSISHRVFGGHYALHLLS